jgi:hypothetical protein
MKRTLCAIAVGTMLVLPGAAAAFGPSANPHAVAACEASIDKQSANGVSAGGGPKAGVPAPTNCDHFYQSNGSIGNGLPGGGP